MSVTLRFRLYNQYFKSGITYNRTTLHLGSKERKRQRCGHLIRRTLVSKIEKTNHAKFMDNKHLNATFNKEKTD